ncbi:hypothetical protein HaLaN_05691 [Haematococcus lacustris]|uniref:Uncharacterized protein n=1 Tax=Haematococcus lacustris TaxID=44745 RepID=A0A699YJH9_HAELA|nr:hypothetical protein HaLaN_05691 [Haematococcus lacustris]
MCWNSTTRQRGRVRREWSGSMRRTWCHSNLSPTRRRFAQRGQVKRLPWRHTSLYAARRTLKEQQRERERKRQRSELVKKPGEPEEAVGSWLGDLIKNTPVLNRQEG